MKRLIEKGNVILDGTLTREEKEKEAFEALGRIEDILEKHNIVSIEHLDEVLTNSRKKVNLAKALCNNKNCLGFITRLNNGKHIYQNDNDLGLDLEGLDFKAPYEKKIYLYKRYYCYYFVEDLDDERGDGVDLETAKALLKECHGRFTPLTDEEKEICDKYWEQF